MTTETDLCNRALDILKEAPITSIDEGRPIARWCKRNFFVIRDALLEEAEWNFAVKRVTIPVDGVAPGYGWSHSFTLPSDCIRVIPITEGGMSESDPVNYEIENGKILSNGGEPLRLRYVYRCTDYARYPATFQIALSARLAMQMAHWLTGKTNYVQIATGMYEQAMSRAWLSDAVQGTIPRPADGDWIASR